MPPSEPDEVSLPEMEDSEQQPGNGDSASETQPQEGSEVDALRAELDEAHRELEAARHKLADKEGELSLLKSNEAAVLVMKLKKDLDSLIREREEFRNRARKAERQLDDTKETTKLEREKLEEALEKALQDSSDTLTQDEFHSELERQRDAALAKARAAFEENTALKARVVELESRKTALEAVASDRAHGSGTYRLPRGQLKVNDEELEKLRKTAIRLEQELNVARTERKAAVADREHAEAETKVQIHTMQEQVRAKETLLKMFEERFRSSGKAAPVPAPAPSGELSEDVERLQAELQALRAAHETGERDLAARQAEYEAVVAERDQMAQERDQTQSERDLIAAERDQIATEREELARKVEGAGDGGASEGGAGEGGASSAELEKVKAELDQARADRERLQKEREQFLKERAEIFQKGASVAAQRDAIAQGRANTAAALDRLSKERDELASQLQALKGGGSGVLGGDKAAAAKLAALAVERDKIAKERDALTQARALGLAERDKLAKERDELGAQLQALKGGGSGVLGGDKAAAAKLAALTAERDKIAKERDALAAARSRSVQEREQLEGERDRLKERVKALMSNEGGGEGASRADPAALEKLRAERDDLSRALAEARNAPASGDAATLGKQRDQAHERVAALEVQLAGLREELEARPTAGALKQAEQDKDDLRKALVESNEARRQLETSGKKPTSAASTRSIALEQQLDKLEKRLEAAGTALAEERKRSERLERELSDAKGAGFREVHGETDEIPATDAAFAAEIDRLKSSAESLEAKLKESEARREDAESRLAQAAPDTKRPKTGKIAGPDAEAIRTLEAQRDATEARLAQACASRDEAVEKAEKALARCAEAEAAMKEAVAAREELAARTDVAERSRAELQAEIDGLRTIGTERGSAVEDLDEQNRRLQGELEDAQAQLSAQGVSFESARRLLEDEARKLRAELAAATRTLDSTAASRSSLAKTQDTLAAERDRLRADNERLIAERDAAQRSKESLAAEQKRKSDDHDTVQRALEDARKQVASATAAAQARERELEAEAKRARSDVADARERTAKQAKAFETARASLEDELKRLREDLETERRGRESELETKTELAHSQETIAAERDRLRAENERLIAERDAALRAPQGASSDDVERQQREFDQTRRQLYEARAERDKAQSNVAVLRVRVEELERSAVKRNPSTPSPLPRPAPAHTPQGTKLPPRPGPAATAPPSKPAPPPPPRTGKLDMQDLLKRARDAAKDAKKPPSP